MYVGGLGNNERMNKILLTLAFAYQMAIAQGDDFSKYPRCYMISDIEHLLSEQGAHVDKEFTVPKGTRWVFVYYDFHGIPVILNVQALPTREQLDSANTALWEAACVYHWLQQTGTVK